MAGFVRRIPALALGGVFLLAGIMKGVDPLEFARQVGTYHLVEGKAALGAAYLLIPLELALGTALVVGYRGRAAAGAAVALLILFMGATAYAWSQGKTEECGCFGSIASRTPGEVLAEDTGFLILGLLAFFLSGRTPIRGRWRGAIVASVLMLGILLPVSAYALPLDPLVTRLKVGRSAGELPLSESPVDLAQGEHLVALLDLDSPDSRRLVKDLNALAKAPGRPDVIAFYGGEVDEKMVFCFNYHPAFEVVAVPRADLKLLYRKLPRFFRLRQGRVVQIWEGRPPSEEDLS